MAGYRAVDHLGGGRSGSSGPRVVPFWRAEDARTLEDVALTVLPVEAADIVREAVDAAEAARHPHNVARGAFVVLDGVTHPAPAPRFSRTPAAIQSAPAAAAGDLADALGRWRG